MKKMKLLLLTLLTVGMVFGCGKKEEAAPEEPAAKEESVTTESVIIETGNMVTSYLTGKQVDEAIGRQRPIAVMFNNIEAGCPQTGISRADVVYEAPVEGRITRLMGVIEDWHDLAKIGSVRSCRDYYVSFALEFDAIYVHFGQATIYVGDMLNSDLVDNLSGAVAGIDRPASKAYMRTDERKAPHNVYTTGQDVLDAVNKFEYSLTYHDTHSQKFIFALPGKRISYDNGTDATVLYPGGKEKGVPNGFSNVQSRFEYNPEDGKYYRYQYGDKHIDEQTGEQLAFDNVIFQYCDGEFRDENGYMAFNVHGGFNPGDSESQSYRAQIFTGGKMVEASWFRVNNESPAIYVGKDGNGVILNPGKTWICLIWNDHADDVVIE